MPRFLTAPGVLRLLVPELVGRLPVGMNSLVIILAVADRTGSYAAAGAAVACYSAAVGVAGPVRGRLADRHGPARVLLISGILQAAAMAALLGALLSGANVVVVFGAALLAGALLPPLGSVMRSIWSHTLAGEELRATAFAFESILLDAIFFLGPALVSLLVWVTSLESTLLIAAVLSLAGALGVALAPAARGLPRGASERHWLGPLRTSLVRRLLPISFLASGSVAAVEIAVVAFAGQRGASAASGALLAVLSAGSVLGGLIYGSVTWQARVARQLAIFLMASSVGYAACVFPRSPWVLGIVLTAAGVFLAPATTCQFLLMDDAAPPGVATESFSWLISVGQLGAAAAVSIAGAISDGGGGGGNNPFILAAVLSAAAALMAMRMSPHRAARVAAPPVDSGRLNGRTKQSSPAPPVTT